MPFQVEKDIDITDLAAVEEETKRLMKQLGYVKTQVTIAEKGVKTLEKTEDLLTSNVDGAKRLRVSKCQFATIFVNRNSIIGCY